MEVNVAQRGRKVGRSLTVYYVLIDRYPLLIGRSIVLLIVHTWIFSRRVGLFVFDLTGDILNDLYVDNCRLRVGPSDGVVGIVVSVVTARLFSVPLCFFLHDLGVALVLWRRVADDGVYVFDFGVVFGFIFLICMIVIAFGFSRFGLFWLLWLIIMIFS